MSAVPTAQQRTGKACNMSPISEEANKPIIDFVRDVQIREFCCKRGVSDGVKGLWKVQRYEGDVDYYNLMVVGL